MTHVTQQPLDKDVVVCNNINMTATQKVQNKASKVDEIVSIIDRAMPTASTQAPAKARKTKTAQPTAYQYGQPHIRCPFKDCKTEGSQAGVKRHFIKVHPEGQHDWRQQLESGVWPRTRSTQLLSEGLPAYFRKDDE